MSNRYGRKQRRAHRAALAEVERRAAESAKAFRQMLSNAQSQARERDEALRLLGAGYAKHIFEHLVERASGEFMQRAMVELARHGIANMQVSMEPPRPDFEQGESVRIVRVLIPHAELNMVVNERRAYHGR